MVLCAFEKEDNDDKEEEDNNNKEDIYVNNFRLKSKYLVAERREEEVIVKVQGPKTKDPIK